LIDQKTLITDVQDNSILVEKDTGKRYWFDEAGADTTTSNTNVNDIAHFENGTSANGVIGEQITSGNALIGKEITSLSFWLYKLNSGSSGSETFTFGIWNSSGVLQKEYGSVTRGQISQGSAYGDATKHTKTDSDGHILQENDIIGIRTNSAPSGWTVEVTQRDSDVYSNGQRAIFVQGSTPATSAKDIGFEVVSRIPATWTYPPTYETDFSSSTGWTTSNSSKVDIDTSANELQIKENGGSLAQMYYDLGSNVSATKWVLRCRILVNGSASSDEVLFKFELNDTSNASANTNSDALGFYVYTDRNNTWSRIYQVCKDSTTSVQGTSASPAYYGNISNSTYYYITLTRSSATDFEVKIRTGSHSGTVLGTLTQSSIPSGLTGLRYITAQTYPQGQGQTMDISDLEFYNGVTSI
jgi:hypothetical protein